MHWRIGRLLLRNRTLDEIEHKIFDIVNHLNLSKQLINPQKERDELAQLNLLAGKKLRLL
jgi:predicted ATPase